MKSPREIINLQYLSPTTLGEGDDGILKGDEGILKGKTVLSGRGESLCFKKEFPLKKSSKMTIIGSK